MDEQSSKWADCQNAPPKLYVSGLFNSRGQLSLNRKPADVFVLSLVHTMEELNFSGNCLKGSRPILSFDANFDTLPHLRLMKELLLHTFGVPKRSRKTKPFVDHVMGFTVVDGKIWVRCYQLNESEPNKVKLNGSDTLQNSKDAPKLNGPASKQTSLNLVEIGPRFVLTPIVILQSSFGGPVIYENKEFVSPNQIRSDLRRAKSGRYSKRADKDIELTAKKEALGLASEGGQKKEKDDLDEKILFA